MTSVRAPGPSTASRTAWRWKGPRITERIAPGQPVTVEFGADHAGTVPCYCNLPIEDGCRSTPGVLVVQPRK